MSIHTASDHLLNGSTQNVTLSVCLTDVELDGDNCSLWEEMSSYIGMSVYVLESPVIKGSSPVSIIMEDQIQQCCHTDIFSLKMD